MGKWRERRTRRRILRERLRGRDSNRWEETDEDAVKNKKAKQNRGKRWRKRSTRRIGKICSQRDRDKEVRKSYCSYSRTSV